MKYASVGPIAIHLPEMVEDNDFLAEEFFKEHKLDLRKDRTALQRLKEAAEKAKQELSSSMETEVTLPFITMGEGGPKHLNVGVTRGQFERLVQSLLEKTIEPCKIALADAGMQPKDVDEVIKGKETELMSV